MREGATFVDAEFSEQGYGSPKLHSKAWPSFTKGLGELIGILLKHLTLTWGSEGVGGTSDLGWMVRAKIEWRQHIQHACQRYRDFERDGEQWVRFTAHLGSVVQLRHRRCEAPLVTMKTIKSSNGHAQVRYVISTTLALGDRVWRVEFTLACRKAMRYRLLLGSKALIDGHLVVSPGVKYVQDKPVFPVSTISAPGAA